MLGKSSARVTLVDSARPLLIATLWQQAKRRSLVITPRAEAARQLYDQVSFYTGDDPLVQLLPEPDFLPYERLVSDRATVQQRMRVLVSLAGNQAPLVIASVYAAAAKTIPPEEIRRSTVNIARGARVDLLDLLRRWQVMGYRMEPTVEVPGFMSRRGGILDIYPPTYDLPARIELFGDTVESIRFFDPATQRSTGEVPSITVTPVMEMLGAGRGDLVSRLDMRGMSDEASARMAEELRMLAEGQQFEEMEFYAPLVNRASALDYLGPDGLAVLDEPLAIRQNLEEIASDAEEQKADLVAKHALPRDFPASCLSASEFQTRAAAIPGTLRMEAFIEGSLDERPPELPFSSPPAYGGRTRVLLEDLRQMLRDGQRIVLVSLQSARLSELFHEAALPFQDLSAGPSPQPAPAQPGPGRDRARQGLETLPPKRTLTLVHGSLSEGWTFPERQTTLLTDGEVFGLAKQRRYLRHRPVRKTSFLSELAVGDYVVHIDHGVGRFVGTTVRQIDDREREYLLLEYAAGDRLMVPTDQIDRVGPYVGASDRPPALTRLGTQEWHRAKQRARASTAQVAKELLAIYAAREVVPGRAFGADTPWQQEMEAAFPYVETPDQLRTIGEVKQDMQQPKPMDRIVAGDVGYGKTEVALRAAFKAVTESTQVAVLVPTTVLAQQHFNTFAERLAPFPVRVEMLSRFRSPKEQEKVVAGLASGEVDICIGTHRLIQRDVTFKNLGLVIVDEEQRFGVGHKERLKQMRKEVDVLSLSATPIPRTLYMALAGVRDMSVMETPPDERLPIKTYVSPFDEHMAREAILREMERGGQVFFVHNRVHNISVLAERLRQIVPEARVLIGHGQMPEDQLESVMLKFAQGKADILLCTTIIESGLDIPNANTLIVNDADRMGLAQLYQLRGRVGRSSNRAYAYFFYGRDRALTETAEKRLKTILSATELGAGFRIAMKDLEIRGAGNLLGTEQHGHIASVGLDLYIRMLAEAVEELKAGLDSTYVPRPTPSAAPTIELPVPAHVPESYVTDLSTRLSLYQRMARIQEPSEVDELAGELRDRFGPWPEPVENLLFMLKVKNLAMKAGVLSIQHQTGEIVLTGDERTWSGLLGVHRPHGDGIRIGHTRVRLDINRLGNKWRGALQSLLNRAGEKPLAPSAAGRG